MVCPSFHQCSAWCHQRRRLCNMLVHREPVPKLDILKPRGMMTLGCLAPGREQAPMKRAHFAAFLSVGQQLERHTSGSATTPSREMRPPLEIGASGWCPAAWGGQISLDLHHPPWTRILTGWLLFSPTLLPCADPLTPNTLPSTRRCKQDPRGASKLSGMELTLQSKAPPSLPTSRVSIDA